MRKGLIIAFALLALGGIGVMFWLGPARPPGGPWRLADGSEISLAGVTYGKNHVMRYGNRIVDYLYPILTPSLRKKFGCKVTALTLATTNDTTVVWFWHKGVQALTSGYAPHQMFVISVVDENGVESTRLYPFNTVVWQKTNVLAGIYLGSYPRRSPEIRLQIRGYSDSKVRGEVTILNRSPTNFPIWHAGPIPFTIRTNDVEISMSKFETGLPERGFNSGTVAEFKIIKDHKPSSDWMVQSFSARSATGEYYEPQYWLAERYGWGGISVFRNAIPLWPQEPAWKITVGLLRTTNFPPGEMWVVGKIPIPAGGERKDLNLSTNMYGSEIELAGVYRSKWPGIANSEPVLLEANSPIPAPDKSLFLVEVRDDHGRKVEFHLDHEVESTGGRGATYRQLDKGYFLYPEKDAVAFTATLAYTKAVSVEFLARPTVAKEAAQKKEVGSSVATAHGANH